jgi:hypothetical protein
VSFMNIQLPLTAAVPDGISGKPLVYTSSTREIA